MTKSFITPILYNMSLDVSRLNRYSYYIPVLEGWGGGGKGGATNFKVGGGSMHWKVGEGQFSKNTNI